MEFFQWARNPWGQEILVRLSWDLLWISVVAGLLFVLGHLFYRWRRAPKPASGASDKALGGAESFPERVVRHPAASRFFHWIMAVAVFALLVTGFLPAVGFQFSWVNTHWTVGLVLVLAVAFHIIHASFRRELRAIWPSWNELKDGWRRAGQILGRSEISPERPGKYALANKLYHHIIVLTTLSVVGTGLLMLARIPTPFLTRNPYFLSDQTWGMVYVLHGFSSVALVALVMIHVYFAILPEKRWVTLSMIFGWIARTDYLEHHDPERWVVPHETPAKPGQSIGASSG